jgi:hypothetical protein
LLLRQSRGWGTRLSSRRRLAEPIYTCEEARGVRDSGVVRR